MIHIIAPVKKFSSKDYKKNDLAFESLQSSFSFLYPHLRQEDYGIDVAVYNGKRAFEKKAPPLCYLEIESKSNWKGKDFPAYFHDVQFLAKKQKYANSAIPAYWVLFNDDCSNAAIINLRKIPSFELSVVFCKTDSIGHDFFYRIPKKEMVWGIGLIERFLIQEAFQTLKDVHNINIS